MDDLTITRDIELDLAEDDLWGLVGNGAAWADWMTDTSDVEVVPGGSGEVVDDGVRREVRIDDVEPGHRVAYRWWPSGEPDAVSTVELVVVPRPNGSALRITETLRASTAAGTALDLRWEVRALALWSRAVALVHA